MIYDILMILFGILLTLGTAIFVAAEFSFVALDSASVERRAANGEKHAKQVLRAIHSLSTQLSGAQVGITLTTILLGYTTQTALLDLFTRLFQNAGLAAALSTTIAVIVSVIVVNAFSMLFGELVPKNLSLADPFHAATLVAPVQTAFTKLLHPLIKLLNDTANGVLRSMNIEPMEEISSARSASELIALVRHSAEEGTLDTSTATLLTKSIGIGELTAIDVMTDRGRMEYLPESASAADVVELARVTGHSRFPIVGNDSDDIVGFVSLRRAIAVPFEKRSDVPVMSSSLMGDVFKVPETLALAPLLIQLRAEGLQIAVVVDEYGGTSGIVTLEDVVEEIVGEVADEHDRRRHGIRRMQDGRWKVPGTLRPDELEERTGVVVPDDGPYETIGGFMMYKLGRIGERGDKVILDDTTLEIALMDGRRIDQVLVQGKESDEAGEAAAPRRNGKKGEAK